MAVNPASAVTDETVTLSKVDQFKSLSPEERRENYRRWVIKHPQILDVPAQDIPLHWRVPLNAERKTRIGASDTAPRSQKRLKDTDAFSTFLHNSYFQERPREMGYAEEGLETDLNEQVER